MTQPASGPDRNDVAWALESLIGRLLVVGTWLAMALVLVGVILMLANGVDPMAHGPTPRFDPARIPADLVSLRPEGFLWSGIVLIIALPIGRVLVAGAGFLAARDRHLSLISLAVFIVVMSSILVALIVEG